MKKLVVANWKMNPQSLAEATDILNFCDEYLRGRSQTFEGQIIFCPPFIFIEEIGKWLQTSALLKYSTLGSQDISSGSEGAWTGEVSGPMLKRLGVEYVIIGHSERRWKMGETDEIVNQKIKIALANDIVPIVCLGEKDRDKSFQEFLKDQTIKSFAGIAADQVSKCIIAYEPVWAISTNPESKPDNPENALESISVIQGALGVPARMYLYGGSITSINAQDFLSKENIDGVLVGGASVKKEEFVKILATI